MEPQDPYAHLGLGKIAARRQKWQETETWCQKPLTLNDKIVDTHRLLGKVLSRQGRRQEAIALLHAGGGVAIVAHPMSLQMDFRELEEKLGAGWTIAVGPREASQIPKFLKNWKA